jgi:hypothetical protein
MRLTKQIPYEHDEQVAFFQWADLQKGVYPELDLMHAIPNGGKLPYRKIGNVFVSPQRMKLIKEGMKSGVPDIHLPVARGKYHSLYIEMKRQGEKPRDTQEEWFVKLRAYDNYVVVCYNCDEAINETKKYLKLII